MALHVLAILGYAVLQRHDLIRPMITGEKYLPMGTPGPALAAVAVGAAINAL